MGGTGRMKIQQKEKKERQLLPQTLHFPGFPPNSLKITQVLILISQLILLLRNPLILENHGNILRYLLLTCSLTDKVQHYYIILSCTPNFSLWK